MGKAEEVRYISIGKTLTPAQVEKLGNEWIRLHTIGRMGTPTRFEPGLVGRMLRKLCQRR